MSESRRILILSNGPLCRNPRVFKEASTLGCAGYDVTVLSVRNHAPSEIQDAALMTGAPFRRITVDMLPGYGTSNIRVFLRRTALWAARKFARFGWLRSIHSLGPAGSLLRVARQQPADLTIVHNEIAHWAGTKLQEEGRLVAADMEDWHSEDLLPDTRRLRPLETIRRVERTLLNRAVYTTTTSHALADALHARYGGRAPAVLTNSFPLQPDPHFGPPRTPPAFFWFSQTLGPGRGLEQFCNAWIQTKHPSRLVLLGDPSSGFAQELLARLPAEFAARVSLQPLVPPTDLPSLIAQHDIGLALEQSSIINRDLTITNKILQYLNAGLAVVATPTAGQREVLAKIPEAGRLIDLNAPAKAALVLDNLCGDPVRLAAAQSKARFAAESIYCWEREAPRLVEIVGAALERSVR